MVTKGFLVRLYIRKSYRTPVHGPDVDLWKAVELVGKRTSSTALEQDSQTDDQYSVGAGGLYDRNKFAASSKKTASQFVTEIIDRNIVRAVRSGVPESRPRACFVHRALMRRFVHYALEEFPYVVSYEDLAPQNIVVDDNDNIKGYVFLSTGFKGKEQDINAIRIIDWGFARVVPFQFLAFPRFLTIEPSRLDAQLVYKDGSSSDFLRPSNVLRADRKYIINYITSSSCPVHYLSRTDISSINAAFLLILSDTNIDLRALNFAAANSKGLREWMDTRLWLLEYKPLQKELVEEVENFLKGNIEQSSGLCKSDLIRAIRV
ncbi:MAG: hypothetical protein Q9217_000181 [Psora testacea]